MNKDKWDDCLYGAKQTDSEIAPLSPEASSRILSAALRENRRSKPSFWAAAPLRVMVSSMALAAVAYGLLPYISPTEVSVSETPVALSVVEPESVVQKKDKEDVTRLPKAGKELPRPTTMPVVPTTTPKPIRPKVMVAQKSAESVKEKRFSSPRNVVLNKHKKEKQGALSQVKPVFPEGTEEGDMYVSVSGDSVLPPADEVEDALTITVTHDVPDTVVGRAEAAALQSVPVPMATPHPAEEQIVPVWTHVRIETGEEPVLTLTALH